jgi:hypothetical protein
VRAHKHKRSALSQHAVGAAVGTTVGAAGGASNSQRRNALEGVVVGLADDAAAKPAFCRHQGGRTGGSGGEIHRGPNRGSSNGQHRSFRGVVAVGHHRGPSGGSSSGCHSG